MGISVAEVSVDALLAHPSLPAMAQSYADECAVHGMPEINIDVPVYQLLEKNGVLRSIAAMRGEELLGFGTLVVISIPHFSVKMGVIESIFVAPEHRDSGAGLRIMNLAEKIAKAQGAIGVLTSVPFDGAFAGVLHRSKKYKHTNSVFFYRFT